MQERKPTDKEAFTTKSTFHSRSGNLIWKNENNVMLVLELIQIQIVILILILNFCFLKDLNKKMAMIKD